MFSELIENYERNKIDIWCRLLLESRFRAAELNIDRQLARAFAVLGFIDHLASVEVLLIGKDAL